MTRKQYEEAMEKIVNNHGYWTDYLNPNSAPIILEKVKTVHKELSELLNIYNQENKGK